MFKLECEVFEWYSKGFGFYDMSWNLQKDFKIWNSIIFVVLQIVVWCWKDMNS